MEDNKWELTHIHIQWGTANENQPMSAKLIAYSHKMVAKGWDKAYKTHW